MIIMMMTPHPGGMPGWSWCRAAAGGRSRWVARFLIPIITRLSWKGAKTGILIGRERVTRASLFADRRRLNNDVSIMTSEKSRQKESQVRRHFLPWMWLANITPRVRIKRFRLCWHFWNSWKNRGGDLKLISTYMAKKEHWRAGCKVTETACRREKRDKKTSQKTTQHKVTKYK